jgi:hypothetical protein
VLNIDDNDYCSFTKKSNIGKLLCEASLILWDEASMTKMQEVEVLDNNLRDLMDERDLPFRRKM